MKKNNGFIAFNMIAFSFLLLACIIAKVDSHSIYVPRSLSGPIFYAVMFLLSVVVLVSYLLFEKRKFIWVLLSFISVCIVNIGYLALSMAGNVSEALLANRIAYFGNVYMLLFLIITLATICGISLGRRVVASLLSVSTLMFLMASTQGYLDLFYRNVDFAIVDGYARILKDYGPMHTVYFLYILAYLGICIWIALYALRKKKTVTAKYCAPIGLIGLVNVLIWVGEQFVPHQIEFLSFSYVLNEILLFGIYRRLVRDGWLNSGTVTMKIQDSETSEKTVTLIMDNRHPDELLSQKGTFELNGLDPDALRALIRQLPAESRLTERETEVAVLLLSNMKRREIAESLFVSEDTIKTHTSHIYGKLNITHRSSLREMARELMDNSGEPGKTEE